MKILFCNIAWMKFYRGVNENDIPVNGGSDPEEDPDNCGEAFNFLQFDRKYYGFVWPRGDMHIERLEGIHKNDAVARDVLVVWIAANPDKSGVYIIGWYRNASVFREMQNLTVNPGESYSYNIVCDVKDGMLLTTDKRTFRIPLATKEGKGKGKGQSHVWYAESAEIRLNFIPKVNDYIDNWKEPSADKIYTAEELWEHHPDTKDKSVNEMGNLEGKQTTLYNVLRIRNSICANDPSVDHYINRAIALWSLGYCDEALKDLQHALTLDPDDLYTMTQIADYHMILKQYKKVIPEYESVINRLNSDENIKSFIKDVSLTDLKQVIYYNLAQAYLNIGNRQKYNESMKLLIKIDPGTKIALEAKEYLKESIRE